MTQAKFQQVDSGRLSAGGQWPTDVSTRQRRQPRGCAVARSMGDRRATRCCGWGARTRGHQRERESTGFRGSRQGTREREELMVTLRPPSRLTRVPLRSETIGRKSSGLGRWPAGPDCSPGADSIWRGLSRGLETFPDSPSHTNLLRTHLLPPRKTGLHLGPQNGLKCILLQT